MMLSLLFDDCDRLTQNRIDYECPDDCHRSELHSVSCSRCCYATLTHCFFGFSGVSCCYRCWFGFLTKKWVWRYPWRSWLCSSSWRWWCEMEALTRSMATTFRPPPSYLGESENLLSSLCQKSNKDIFLTYLPVISCHIIMRSLCRSLRTIECQENHTPMWHACVQLDFTCPPTPYHDDDDDKHKSLALPQTGLE